MSDGWPYTPTFAAPHQGVRKERFRRGPASPFIPGRKDLKNLPHVSYSPRDSLAIQVFQ